MIIQWSKGTYKQGQDFLGSGLAAGWHSATVAATVVVTVIALSLLTRSLALNARERILAFNLLSRILAMTVKDWQEIASTDWPYTFPFYFATPPTKVLTVQDRTLALNVKGRNG